MSIVGSVTVRVVPSFTGVHKQIAQQVVGTASKAGADAGASLSRSMSASMNLQAVGGQIKSLGDQVSSLGSTLTKSITVPIAGATLAAGGLVGALGWGRLKSVDTAQAQLRGLGYSTEDVARISDQLVGALEGGMLTMGQATSAAAAGMAAGVEEGEELTRYIQLLDAATAGSNGTFEEMNQIFARIQGSGRLMTNELDMIEQRMPGFSGAAAEHFGVSQEALREMVSAGEVSADEFLGVMDSFAGDMATEYAKSWEGMVQNTKAYIGILGENLLGGVFQQSKEAIAEFIDFLASDQVATWATGMGETIGGVFSDVLATVRDAIDWWIDLDTETKKLFGTLAGVAVAAGPFLLIVGKIITGFGSLISSVGVITGWIGKLAGSFGLASGASGAGGFLSAGLRLIPVVGWIAGVVTTLWSTSEGFRESLKNLASTMWGAVMGAFETLKPHVMGLWESLKDLWDSLSQGGGLLDTIGTFVGWVLEMWGEWQEVIIGFVSDAISGLIIALDWVVQALTWVSDAVSVVIDWVKDLGDESTTQGEVFAAVWESIKDAAAAVVDWLVGTAWPFIQMVWEGIVDGAQWLWSVLEPIFGFVAAAFQTMVDVISWVWEGVLRPVFQLVGDVIGWLWTNVAQPIFGFIGAAWSALVTGIQWVWDNVLQPVFSLVGDIIRWLWNNVAKPIFGWIQDRWETLAIAIRVYYDTVIKPVLDWFADKIGWLWENGVKPALGWISDRWSWLSGKISGFWNDRIKPILEAFGKFIKEDVPGMVSAGVDLVEKAWRKVANFFRDPINAVIDFVWNDGIKAMFDSVAKAVGSDTRLGKIERIPKFATGGAVSGPGTGTSDDIIARLSDGEHVLTAAEVKALGGHDKVYELRRRIQSGEDIFPDVSRDLAGSSPSQAALPMGGWISDGVDWLKDKAASALSWVRGRLADTAERFIKPFTDGIAEHTSAFGSMGKLSGDMIRWGVDEVLDWIRGEDAAFDVYGGDFAGEMGALFRPSAGPITSWFGPRWGSIHSGIDIAGGGPTYAAYNGVVQKVGWNILPGRTGIGILLGHGNGVQTYYGHNPSLGAIPVSVGDQVDRGQRIGMQGATGNVTGIHLHWERLVNGRPQNVNSLFRDKGGLIYPGMNQVLNETGKAEYVFNQQQFENLNRLAERGGNGRGDTFIQNVNNHGSPYQDGHDFKMHVSRARRKAGV